MRIKSVKMLSVEKMINCDMPLLQAPVHSVSLCVWGVIRNTTCLDLAPLSSSG